MRPFESDNMSGFALIELVIVIAVIAILAAIAIPRYAVHLKKAEAASCLTNRRLIETEEISRLAWKLPSPNHHSIENLSHFHGQSSVMNVIRNMIHDLLPWQANEAYAVNLPGDLPPINPDYTCPSGGTYLWLQSDPAASDFPKVGCSLHYGTVSIAEESGPNFIVPSGENISINTGFDTLKHPPKAKSWRILPNAQIEGWQNSAGGIEIWSSGMLGIKAPSGEYFIELDAQGKSNGKSGQPDSISQQVNTEAGRVYLIQLKAQARKAGTSDFQILWDGVSASTVSPTPGIWSDYSVKVVGTGAPISLTIAEIADQNNGYGALLDSISIVATNETRQ